MRHDHHLMTTNCCYHYKTRDVEMAMRILTCGTRLTLTVCTYWPQETCLYPRLNAALRSRDERMLEPWLPYMKLLLTALYQLPLVHMPTYRGVKLELHKVRCVMVVG